MWFPYILLNFAVHALDAQLFHFLPVDHHSTDPAVPLGLFFLTVYYIPARAILGCYISLGILQEAAPSQPEERRERESLLENDSQSGEDCSPSVVLMVTWYIISHFACVVVYISVFVGWILWNVIVVQILWVFKFLLDNIS